MGWISGSWTDAVAAAKKDLGKDGSLPKPRLDIVKALEDLEDAGNALQKKQDELESAIDALEAASSKVTTAVKAYRNMVDGDDFDLDDSDPKSKKIIASVTKDLLKTLGDGAQVAKSYDDLADDIDKFLAGLQHPKK